MTGIIEAENLTKVYPDGTKAVNGISFRVEEGEFFGFLGPNGAGKTTTIKVLTTLLPKTEGSVILDGLNVQTDAKRIRRLIGVQSQETVIDEDLTGRENLVLQGNLHGMRGQALQQRVIELLKIVDLDEVADKRGAFYSSGMKKRLDLASVLVHRPRLLFLDEPTTGLDPQSRATMWSYLRKLNREEGTTIFLTTQYMDEADKLCHRLSIIDHGEIVAQGSPTELKQQIGADTINLALGNGDANGNDARAKVTELLRNLRGVGDIVDAEGGLTIYARNGGHIIADVVRALDEAKVPFSSISLSTPTLDDVFLKHTGRRIRAEELKRPSSTRMFGRRRR